MIFQSLSGGSLNKAINVFITGKTGVGKSSLLNAIAGPNQFEEGKNLDGVTRGVTQVGADIHGVRFNIWDSPGLQDITEDDQAITEKIKHTLKNECTHLHLFLYCIRMDCDRIERNEFVAIKQLTDIFSNKIWETSVFVLTFGNMVLPPPEEDTKEKSPSWFKKRIQEFREVIIKALLDAGISPEKAAKVPVIPAGYHTSTRTMANSVELLDRSDWFTPFWFTCANIMNENLVISLFMASAKQRNSDSNTENTVDKEEDLEAKIEEIRKNQFRLKREMFEMIARGMKS